MSNSDFTVTVLRSCKKCGLDKWSSSGKCKECARAYAVLYRAENRDKLNAARAAKYAVNPDARKISAAKWRAANPEQAKASSRAWSKENSEKVRTHARANAAKRRLANPEKEKARGLKWHKNNPEKSRANSKAWSKANKEKHSELISLWWKNNHELRRVHKQNRRARASGSKLSLGLAAKLFKLQKGMCPCCKQPLGDDYHLDHIIPLVRGGSNTDDNMQLLRAKCNLQKHAKHPVDFMQERGFLL